VAARTQSRPLYAVFLEQVIQIEAVQRERAAVTDEHTADFFRLGRIPGEISKFLWSLERPKPVIAGIQPPPMSPAMQRAWGAAVVAWRAFIGRLVSGELIASGVHPASGIRSDLDPAEWIRSAAVLDVRDGDLFTKERDGQLIPRWTSITLRAAKRSGQKKARGHGYDWKGAWAYALTLRAEDQWDWTKHQRDERQPLPAVHKTVEDKIVQWFEARGNVPHMIDIRQNITIPLYAGRRTRGKRKR
jgi:hypothetical protein